MHSDVNADSGLVADAAIAVSVQSPATRQAPSVDVAPVVAVSSSGTTPLASGVKASPAVPQPAIHNVIAIGVSELEQKSDDETGDDHDEVGDDGAGEDNDLDTSAADHWHDGTDAGAGSEDGWGSAMQQPQEHDAAVDVAHDGSETSQQCDEFAVSSGSGGDGGVTEAAVDVSAVSESLDDSLANVSSASDDTEQRSVHGNGGDGNGLASDDNDDSKDDGGSGSDDDNVTDSKLTGIDVTDGTHDRHALWRAAAIARGNNRGGGQDSDSDSGTASASGSGSASGSSSGSDGDSGSGSDSEGDGAVAAAGKGRGLSSPSRHRVAVKGRASRGQRTSFADDSDDEALDDVNARAAAAVSVTTAAPSSSTPATSQPAVTSPSVTSPLHQRPQVDELGTFDLLRAQRYQQSPQSRHQPQSSEHDVAASDDDDGGDHIADLDSLVGDGAAAAVPPSVGSASAALSQAVAATATSSTATPSTLDGEQPRALGVTTRVKRPKYTRPSKRVVDSEDGADKDDASPVMRRI